MSTAQRLGPVLLVLAAVNVVVGCPNGPPDESYVFDLPPGFPEPLVPADNPMSEAKVELGRHLFFDTRLSVNGTQSCASCHHPEKAFTDGEALPEGATGDLVPRNSMSLANVGYFSFLTWANPVLTSLESQALVPLFADHPDPIELGLTAVLDDVLATLGADPTTAARFQEAFPKDDDPISVGGIVQALGSFQRTLISGDSRFDRYFLQGTEDLSDEEKLGLELFFSERAECYHCHGGTLFTTAFVTATSVATESTFENNGLAPRPEAVGGLVDEGMFAFTGEERDRGRFRVPSLRNIEVTGPYMHDGRHETLEDVVAHYRRGGDGLPAQSPLVFPLDITDAEAAALVAFLKTLTDDTFLADPRFQDPNAEE